jgi:uncharacterized membrane protein HdeD (DUF308 family)
MHLVANANALVIVGFVWTIRGIALGRAERPARRARRRWCLMLIGAWPFLRRGNPDGSL